jgi:hypothetical protein
LSFEGNVSENWKNWKQRFELYMIASGAVEKPSDVKVAILLHVLGEEAIEKYNTFNLSEEESKNYDKVIKVFNVYCVPKINETVERHIFFSRFQKEGESFDNFFTDLKKLSLTCNFKELKDSLIWDWIIIGCFTRPLSVKIRVSNQT